MGSTKKEIISVLMLAAALAFTGLTACDTDQASLADSGSKQVSGDVAETSGSAGGTIPDDGVYSYTYDDTVHISSTVDGETVVISANIFIPIEKRKGQEFPAIVFINSWACNEYEYVMQARKFAAKGYVVLSYECRGWYKSEGKIAMGTEADWQDFSAILDWLLDNAPVDVDNIGVAGISLGGGGSLHAISRDDRVKTVAALSSYIDAYDSMYSAKTPRLVWGSLLALTGATLGNLDQWIWDLYFCTMSNTNIDWVEKQAATQSPITFVDRLNARNRPVYLSHNFGDYMFMPNTTMEYYNALTVDHKRLDLCQGTHATAEIPGAAGLPNYTFYNVHRWFDYWLKGIDTGIVADADTSAVVTMMVKGSGEHVVYDDLKKWPPENQKSISFYCRPGTEKNRGDLSAEENEIDQVSTILSGPVSGAASGVPIISAMLEGFNVLFNIPLSGINPLKAVVYQTTELDAALRLRGIATVNLRVALSGSRGQVFAYLYDVDESGMATFITHAFQTWWDTEAGIVMDLPLEFVANAYDIEAGHRLALVIDTRDSAYGAPTVLPYQVSLVHDDGEQMELRIPVE